VGATAHGSKVEERYADMISPASVDHPEKQRDRNLPRIWQNALAEYDGQDRQGQGYDLHRQRRCQSGRLYHIVPADARKNPAVVV
jgi:hypothetical protein